MPDKPRKLPPPPEGQNAFTEALTGVRNFLGLGPVAYSRISRTPIYTGSVPTGSGGQYNRLTKSITLPPEALQHAPEAVQHESAHALYDQAGFGLTPKAETLSVPSLMNILDHPELYGSKPDPRTIANEGLAYSVGTEWGEPYVKQIASQMKDRKLAEKLLRLHQNAIGGRYNSWVKL